MHVGQPVLAALKLVGESLVVDAELLEDGGLYIVNMYAALGDIESEVVGSAVGMALLDAGSGHP